MERRHYDEMRAADGSVRAHFRALADWLAETPAKRVAESTLDAFRSDALGKVRGPGAIIHGSSGSGQTFFVEPAALVEDNNALREAESAAIEEERKVRRELSAKVNDEPSSSPMLSESLAVSSTAPASTESATGELSP